MCIPSCTCFFFVFSLLLCSLCSSFLFSFLCENLRKSVQKGMIFQNNAVKIFQQRHWFKRKWHLSETSLTQIHYLVQPTALLSLSWFIPLTDSNSWASVIVCAWSMTEYLLISSLNGIMMHCTLMTVTVKGNLNKQNEKILWDKPQSHHMRWGPRELP